MDFDVCNSDDSDSEDGEQDMDFDNTSGGSNGNDKQSSDGEDSGISRPFFNCLCCQLFDPLLTYTLSPYSYSSIFVLIRSITQRSFM